MESTSQNPFSSLQHQLASMRERSDRLHERNIESLKSEYLQLKEDGRKIEAGTKEAFVEAKKAEALIRTKEENNEDRRNTCQRLRSERNESRTKLEDVIERYDELPKEHQDDSPDDSSAWDCS